MEDIELRALIRLHTYLDNLPVIIGKIEDALVEEDGEVIEYDWDEV